MRKSLILTLLLLFLSITGITGISILLHHQENATLISARTLYGDPAPAAGLSVALNAKIYGGTLDNNWDLTYRLSKEGTLKTDVQHSAYEKKTAPKESKEIRLSTHLSGSITLPENAPEKKFRPGDPIEAISEAIGETSANQLFEKTINLTDYYDWLPVHLEKDGYMPSFTADKTVQNQFTDFSYFKVPVPDSYMLNVSVKKNFDGIVSSTVFDPDKNSADYRLDDSGIILQKYCYIALTRLKKNDNSVNIPLSKDMRGIHAIPLTTGTNNKKHRFLNMEGAKLVYAISDDEEVLELYASNDEKTLFLLTLKENAFFAAILLPEKDGTLKEVQKFNLLSGFEGFRQSINYGYRFFPVPDGFVLALENGDFCTVAKVNGQYQIGTRSSLKACPEVAKAMEPIPLYDLAATAAVNGTKTYFLIPCTLPDDFIHDYGPNHFLLVYDKKNLIYAGKISYSFDHSEEIPDGSTDDPDWNQNVPVKIIADGKSLL